MTFKEKRDILAAFRADLHTVFDNMDEPHFCVVITDTCAYGVWTENAEQTGKILGWFTASEEDTLRALLATTF